MSSQEHGSKEYREHKRRTQIEKAYSDGQDAVRCRPLHSPSNPYEYDEQPELALAWEQGATSAGWNDIYTNGVLNITEV